MEETEGFNTEKSNVLIVKKENEKEEMVIELKKGMIREVQEYKFLGNWINSKGNMDRHVQELEKKTKGIITEINKTMKEQHPRKLSTKAGYWYVNEKQCGKGRNCK